MKRSSLSQSASYAGANETSGMAGGASRADDDRAMKKRASFSNTRDEGLADSHFGDRNIYGQQQRFFEPPRPPLPSGPRSVNIVRSPSPMEGGRVYVGAGTAASRSLYPMAPDLNDPSATGLMSSNLKPISFHRSLSAPTESMNPRFGHIDPDDMSLYADPVEDRRVARRGIEMPIIPSSPTDPLGGDDARFLDEPSPSATASISISPRTVADTSDKSNKGQKKEEQTSSSSKSSPEKKSDNNERTSRDYYFDSYSHHGIHEEMLKDEVRTRTYQMAVLNNSHLFEGKTVLDVGCGTGVLSMFCAQAGAAHVYGIDCSTIIDQAKAIVSRNGFEDKITLIKGKVEEVELPIDNVDIIISEWMGYFLLYESMLDTVIFARDKWLAPGGLMFPDKAVMYLCAIEDAQVKHDRIDFWDNVYGFDMTPLKEIALTEPVVDVVDANHVLSDSQPILNVDILTCTKEDLAFTSPFRLTAQRNDYVHGFVAYFECAFTQVHKPIGFSTAPFAKYTHWKQTIFYTRQTLTICEGEEISGTISCKPNPKNNRDLDIAMDVQFNGQHSQMDSKLEFRLR